MIELSALNGGGWRTGEQQQRERRDQLRGISHTCSCHHDGDRLCLSPKHGLA
jgi:hypothetical protein